MDVETAIRTRRTHKQFGAEPVDDALLRDLLELARHAPNHHLTQPWRFRILGPETRRRLEDAAGEKEAAKLRRAPTLVLASAALSGDERTDEEICTRRPQPSTRSCSARPHAGLRPTGGRRPS